MAGANTSFQITDLDFVDIKNNLKQFLRSQDVLKDYNYEGSALNTLLDVLAYNTQYNAYYLNMVANEMFLDTALQRNSVVSQAKLLNYTPKSAIAPQATINLTVNGVTDSSLTLPKFTSFLSEAVDGVNYNFVNTDAYTVNVNNGTASFQNVILKQGIPNTLSFIVDESTNPTFTFKIPEINVDTTSLVVSVQESSSNTFSNIYNRSTNFLTLNGSSTAYFLQEGLNGFYEVYFGDGILGKKLSNGNVVNLSYITTQGTSAAGANSFVIMDSVGGFSNISITPLFPATQGSPKESISSIKFQAPKSYSAQNRAVTKEDYITVIQQNNLGYSFDAVNVWGGQENDPPVYGQVFVALKPTGGYLFTESQKLKLVNEVLKPISLMTIQPTIVDPDYTYIQITANVLFDPKKTNLTSSQIRDSVKTAINNYAKITLNTFNSTFNASEFNNVIKTVSNSIIANEINIKLQKKFYPNLSSPTTYTLNFGVKLEKGLFFSGITSSPSVIYRNPLNLATTINNSFIEEVPSSTGGLESITVTNPGFGYQYPPDITILGDGSEAKAEAVLVNGTIREIKVTNKGSGYTAAIVKITPKVNDSTGTLGSATAILEGRYGTLRSYYNDTENIKVIFQNNIGSVDYNLGKVILNAFNPLNVNNDLGQLTITANPTTTIISSSYNRIITVDEFDPNSIIVNVTAKTT